ncbi:helix-turn-helix domain-containing protein [Citricoccus sp. GCM10030269]|uniref:helix-turn-helix domain-containing protein n=1 Tax=Citricoccus sp. GCM10030269 TaxID=3273388 RepID=UPI0036108C61
MTDHATIPWSPLPRDRRRPVVEPLWREALGEQLRRMRHARQETIGQTAHRAGVSPQYLSEMERGVKDPSSEMIAAVAHALDATLIDVTLAVAGSVRSTVAPAPQSAHTRTTLALAA